MIVDPSFKYVAGACALTQFLIGYLLRDAYFSNVILMGLIVGPCYCNAITNSLHEIIHDLAFFGMPLANKIFGGAVNLSMAWPIVSVGATIGAVAPPVV